MLLATVVVPGFGAGARQASAADYVETVLSTPNLLGYWRFTAASQADSLVNGYTGTFQGDAQVGPASSGPALVSDPANTAVVLDGAGDYVMSAGASPLRGQIVSEGTILAWFNLAILPSAAGRIFTIAGESQVGNDFDLQIEPDDRIRFFTEAGASTDSPAALTASDLNTWHFVGATFQANVADSRILYLDGVPVASSTPGAHVANSSLFNIGESDVFQGRFFQGRIDEVAVFDRALTAAEIAAI